MEGSAGLTNGREAKRRHGDIREIYRRLTACSVFGDRRQLRLREGLCHALSSGRTEFVNANPPPMSSRRPLANHSLWSLLSRKEHRADAHEVHIKRPKREICERGSKWGLTTASSVSLADQREVQRPGTVQYNTVLYCNRFGFITATLQDQERASSRTSPSLTVVSRLALIYCR